ncbi:MAG: HAMP domain-containing protein [Proteobacteria bacterium]|nr:HAMP domain-containing protein [Pseudomonadota bacterium]
MQISFLKPNIRHKVALAMLLFFLGIGGMSYLSYSYLLEIEKKVTLVEVADDLTNIVLEIRRTEKNLLLFGEESNLTANRQYIQQALALLENIAETLNMPSVEQELADLRDEIRAYGNSIKEITSRSNIPERERQALIEKLREYGQRLMGKSADISRYERADILRINLRLRDNLLYSVIVLLAIGLGAFLFVIFKIILPLKLIEQTTASIAKGNFQPMEVRNTNDEIQRVMEALNHMVAELDKRRDQLVQAQKLSSIGTLASGIAHQLNNPLNNISTSCQILMEEPDCNQDLTTRMLGNIDQETIRARDIVRGLLEFARHQEFSLEEFSLLQVVERAVRLTSSQAPPGISLKVDIPDTLLVKLDFQRMQEALINLILNAFQAIAPAQGTVTLTGSLNSAGESALITVRDTGTGIAEQDLACIFDPFFTTKEVGTGTGLGLFVVYGIIKQHRGRIWAESSQGKGTAIHIELPLDQED